MMDKASSPAQQKPTKPLMVRVLISVQVVHFVTVALLYGYAHIRLNVCLQFTAQLIKQQARD
jgi:hypothetical protein